MRLAADHSETLKVFYSQTDDIIGDLYISQSVVCEMATVQERARWGLQVRAFLERTFPGRWKGAHIEVY
jgi:hypothetical protein